MLLAVRRSDLDRLEWTPYAAIDVPAQPTWRARSIVARLIEPVAAARDADARHARLRRARLRVQRPRGAGARPCRLRPDRVLWATLFLVSVVLFRPIEQTLARGIAERLAHGRTPGRRAFDRRRAGRRRRAVAAVAGILAGTGSPLTRPVRRSRRADAALALGIIGYARSFIVRGLAQRPPLARRLWAAAAGRRRHPLRARPATVVLRVPAARRRRDRRRRVRRRARSVCRVARAALDCDARAPRSARGGGRRPFQLRHALAFAAPAGRRGGRPDPCERRRAARRACGRRARPRPPAPCSRRRCSCVRPCSSSRASRPRCCRS